jgi:hypothetical protein
MKKSYDRTLAVANDFETKYKELVVKADAICFQ